VRLDASLSILALAFVVSDLPARAADILTRGANLSVDVSPADGTLAMDLAGDIWTLPPGGGEATLISKADEPLSRPRWSPDGARLLYQSTGPDGSAIWLSDLDGSAPRKVGPDGVHNQQPSWHPQGERIVYASDRNGTGLDIWETDLPTGLAWRLTDDPGDETEPTWARNGRHLAWISHAGDRYALVIRRHGEPDVTLVDSDVPLSSPSWRPDGSLLTFLRHDPDGATLAMVILSDPVLVRDIDASENYFSSPVAWRDRLRLVYTAGGTIRTRDFEDRRSRPLHFRAILNQVPAPAPRPIVQRKLVVAETPDGRLIIRGSRLFDGVWPGYRRDFDVIIEAGRIVAVEPRRDRDDGTILDLGAVTIIPGLIDAWGNIEETPGSGAALLAYGVTTVATRDRPLTFDPLTWEGEAEPGPRLLSFAETEQPDGILGIADAATPGIDSLINSRQALALGQTTPPARRFATPPALIAPPNTIVVGSAANRMPPGIGLHAELRALAAAGLSGEQALHAVGGNAARILGIENQAGTITPGAVADLVLVAGDPLHDLSDLLRIVAVVRNGRLFSLVSLLEKAGKPSTVE